MRIALVCPLVTPIREPQRGGSQAFVSDLAVGLAERGHEVHVYAARGSEIPGVSIQEVEVDASVLDSTLYRVDGKFERDSQATRKAFARAYAMVRETRYDVVHNHAFDASAIELATGLEMPVVHTLHLPPDDRVAQALGKIDESPRRPGIAAVSAAQARAWRRVHRVDAILPPFVPTSRIPWSASPGSGAVFAGRLSPDKGAAEALAIARAARVPIAIFGDPYDPDYARQVTASADGVDGATFHAGIPRAELWEQLTAAAVVICPALWEEPFGMVAAEAQACGTPVVAFARGALAEVVQDRVTGFLVPPGDVKAAAEAVGRVGSISRLACRQHAEHNLDLEQSISRHEAMYLRIASWQGVAAGG